MRRVSGIGRLLRLKAAAIFGLTTLSVACSYTPTTSSPFTSPATQVLTGTVYPTGRTTLWLTTTQAGTLSVSLTDAEPPAITLGLALGVLKPHEKKCDLITQARVQPGSKPQITAQAGAGTYCVEVSDTGVVALSGAPFSVTVSLQ